MDIHQRVPGTLLRSNPLHDCHRVVGFGYLLDQFVSKTSILDRHPYLPLRSFLSFRFINQFAKRLVQMIRLDRF